MQRLILALICLLLLWVPGNLASAQTAEVQLYPAGVTAVVGHTFFPNDLTEGRLFAGVNITNRRNWGVQDDESGHGFGGGVDINRVLPVLNSRLLAGGRVDIWSMRINWRNDTLGITADSRILVFQPTARLLYRLREDPANSLHTIDLSLSLGAEVNIATHGQPVGEGAILLAGVRIGL